MHFIQNSFNHVVGSTGLFHISCVYIIQCFIIIKKKIGRNNFFKPGFPMVCMFLDQAILELLQLNDLHKPF